jgi:hypothetical protein
VENARVIQSSSAMLKDVDGETFGAKTVNNIFTDFRVMMVLRSYTFVIVIVDFYKV